MLAAMYRTTDPVEFLAHVPRSRPMPPLRGVLLVRPDGFRLSEQASTDNRYMASGVADTSRALAEHDAVVAGLRDAGIVVEVVDGDPQWPDACYPNNAIATMPDRSVIFGRLRHPDRQGEPRRREVRERMMSLGYGTVIDWSNDASAICELTGSLVIDHARGIGYLGRSERMNAAGADLIAAHWDLDLLFEFDLAPGEYHTNVVLAILAGRACVIAPSGFADARVADAITRVYGDQVITLTPEQQSAFAGNILSLGEELVAMSQTAADAFGAVGLAQLAAWGFSPVVVPIPELEKGGGSMRCLLCELW